jgi:hypothetical protein
VAIQGNDHLFEYNVVRNVVTETDDAGALYKGRNPSCRGNVIRYNFWRDIGSPMGHGTAAVYFDDGDGGDTVLGNVFYRCGHPGRGSFGTVFSHGGHDNRAENNLFIECQRALGSAPRGDQLWKKPSPAELWVTDADTGFVDAARGDFRLRPDAEVLKRLPGFQPIPFDQIGLEDRRAQ